MEAAVLPPDLGSLQRWMQAVVMHTGPFGEALASRGAAAVLAPQRAAEVLASPLGRLEVYHGMYTLRVEQAMAIDFSALREHIGDEAFARLARDYLLEHPTSSYTLSRAGDHLPGFLSTWRGVGVRRRRWLADLARLELEMAKLEDEPESPALTPAAVRSVPAQAWDRVRLVPVASLRLLTFRHAVNDVYERHLHDLPPRPPRPGPSWLVLCRRGGRSLRLPLERCAHALLAALASGHTLGEALASAGIGNGRERRVFSWLRDWVGEGLFAEVAVS
jgi:hypothetical protein